MVVKRSDFDVFDVGVGRGEGGGEGVTERVRFGITDFTLVLHSVLFMLLAISHLRTKRNKVRKY